MQKAHERVDIKYGILSPRPLSAYTIDGSTYIKGRLFNEFSTVAINSKPVDTEFINSTLLKISTDLIPDDVITVVQQAANHTILGESQTNIIYTNLMIVPDELKYKYLDALVPDDSDYYSSNSHIIDDATAEFSGGYYEHDLLEFEYNHDYVNSSSAGIVN